MRLTRVVPEYLDGRERNDIAALLFLWVFPLQYVLHVALQLGFPGKAILIRASFYHFASFRMFDLSARFGRFCFISQPHEGSQKSANLFLGVVVEDGRISGIYS